MAHEHIGEYEFQHGRYWEPRHRRRREEWEERWREDEEGEHGWHGLHQGWPLCGLGPSLVHLTLAKPYLLMATAAQWLSYYRHVSELGLRFSEMLLYKPLIWERFAWDQRRWEYGPHHPHHDGHPEEECRRDPDCHEEWERGKCEERCERCGRERHACCCERRGGVNLRIVSRAGDVRNKIILVENNSPHLVTVTPEAEAWMDASGATSPSTVTFSPGSQDIAPGEAKEFKATIVVTVPPLQEGLSYFSRIHLKGCGARPISLELCVEPAGRMGYIACADPCRPRHSGCVEFVEECREPPRRHRYGGDPCDSWHHHRRWDPFWLPPLRRVGYC